MKARPFPSTDTELHMGSEPRHEPYAAYTADMQDLFSHAMDRALGMQKASLDAVAKMQSEVLEMQKHLYESEPAFSNMMDLAFEAYGTCLEIQMTWLDLLAKCAQQGIETWMQLASMGVMLATGVQEQAQGAMRQAVRGAA